MAITQEEARRRLDLQRGDLLARIDRSVRDRNPDTYAGTWLDHETFRVVVALTDGAEAEARDLAQQYSEIGFTGRDVRYTASELESTYLAVTAIRLDLGFQADYGLEFTVMNDAMNNRVVVGAEAADEIDRVRNALHEYISHKNVDVAATLALLNAQRLRDPAYPEELIPDLITLDDVALWAPRSQRSDTLTALRSAAALDEIVTIENQGELRDDHFSECTSRSHCFALRAGLYPYRVYNASTGLASSGFSVKNGTLRGTTSAGHAYSATGSGLVRHGGTTLTHNIGYVTGRIDSGAVDALWVRINNPPYQAAAVYGGPNITGLRNYSQLGFNTYVCSYYGRSYTTDGCGYIQTNQASHNNNYNLIAISESYMDAQSGDSGSPYVVGSQAASMHVGSNSSYVMSSAMELVLDALQVSLSTTT